MRKLRFYNSCISAFLALLSTGCGSGEVQTNAGNPGSAGLRVRVVDDFRGSTARVPDALVVLGDASGAMVATGTTDANGEYRFNNPPANATVTTAMVCDSPGGGQNGVMYAVYDVNVSAVSLGGCTPLAPLGTMNLQITNSITSAASHRVYIGRDSYYYGSLISSTTVTVYRSQLQSDGNLSIVVLALDANGPLGYGMVLDRPFVNGMTVAVAVDQPMSRLQYAMTNISGAVTMVGSQINLSRGGRYLYFVDTNLASSMTSTTIDVAYIPGFSTEQSYYASVYLDRNGNGVSDAIMTSAILGDVAAPAGKSFSFGAMPPIPASVAVSYATGTARPTLSWSGTNGSSTRVGGYVSFVTTGIYLNFSAAPARTSVVFPELPDSLAVFRPNGQVYLFTITNAVSSAYSGYPDYLTRRDQSVSGTWSIPANTLNRQGTGLYNSQLAAAPPLHGPFEGSPRGQFEPCGHGFQVR